MAQDEAGNGKNAEKPDGASKKPEAPKEVLHETRHQVHVGGAELRYKASAGNLVLKDEDGTPKANLVFVAYTKEPATDASQRPITFAFNGGPGSSSVWLHLGTFGPKRVEMGPEGEAPPPPYRLVDNAETLLDVTDLVFIDPVTTGYSRAVPGDKAKDFHGVDKDLESVADFIRLWTTRFRRWASPKFLAGESYGTTRAAGLADLLQRRHGMFLNGVLLVSCVLSFQTVRFGPANDLPYVLFLPTYTATAFHHRRLAPELQEDLRRTLDEVEDFAMGDYTLALMRGSALPAAQRADIARRLARYTGLSAEFIERCDLRVEIGRFCKELLRAERRTVGRLDSRFVGFDRDSAGERFELDPSYSAIQGPFTATLNHYLRTELLYESDLPYEVLTDRVAPWNFGQERSEYLDMSEPLRAAMAMNPALKAFVANGYYDLATPYLATEYTFRHLGLEPLQERVIMAYYDAGHMMYIKTSARVRLKADAARFIRSALPEA
jgi:carboxypeptidase C (cathepsin A)